jgi:ribonuclease HI
MNQSSIQSFFKISKEIPQIETIKTDDDEYILYFDGCSKGNPGLAGAGAVIYKNGLEIYSESVFVGTKETNNKAEYTGLLIGLVEAIRQNIRNLKVKGDSQLVIKQMKGEYKVGSTNIMGTYQEAKKLQQQFHKISFEHVYREHNKRADELSNQGIKGNCLIP